MSTKKRQPLGSISQLPATPRWAPSTPHAIRALQHRSGGRRKSTNINRPDSARNILRQLAKITAAQTKRRPSTPRVNPSTSADKENVYTIAQEDEDLESGELPERPDFTLPIDEGEEEDDASVAPTQQELPGGEDYTFKSIDFASRPSRTPTSIRSDRVRKATRMSIRACLDEEAGEVQDDDGDLTAQSIEYGRRAVSEGPAWDRYPRSSFGSIRMSEFGLEESRLGKEPEGEKSLVFDDQHADMNADMDNGIEFDNGDETEDLRRFRKSMSEPVDDGLFVPDPGFLDDENTFRLNFAQDESRSASFGLPIDAGYPHVLKPVAEDVTSQSLQQSPSPVIEPPPGSTRQMTEIETAVPSRPRRRKKLKLTQKGNAVPALPSSLVKKVAIDSMTRIGKKRPVISREHLAALEQATEWFFEQVGEDLEAYSNHAKRRKRIDDTDVTTLMKRQRVIGRGQSLDELAQEFLPDEILLNLTLPDED